MRGLCRVRFHVEAVTGAEKDFGISSPSDDSDCPMASIFFWLVCHKRFVAGGTRDV